MISGLLLACWVGFSQSQQIDYLEAKRLFGNGQYLSAKAAFSALTESDIFGAHASFYYGLSAFKLQDYRTAKDMFRQVLVQFPQWDQKSEILYWLALSNFETEDYNRALIDVSQLSELSGNSDTEKQIIFHYLLGEDIEILESLYAENNSNRFLAEALVRALLEMPYKARDFNQINKLITKWDFNLYELDPIKLPVIKKDIYSIAVVLPFLFESLDNTTLITQNRLVMDMYQGMLLASEDLAEESKPVELYPYDTKKRAQYTENIIASKGFESHDLIIGPLYPQPNNIVRTYAEEKQINHFNPISSNSQVMGNSPFSFLIKPSTESQAARVADFAISERINDYAMIFYEQSERDSIYAAIFKERLERDSIKVIWYQAITKQNSRRLLDTLTAQYDNYLTKSEADSLIKISGRLIRNRRIRKDELRKIERDNSFVMPISYDDEGNPIVYYEKQFYMQPDSVSTILAATRSNLFANNLISAVETRGDSISLFGYGEWLDFTMLSFNQLDRLKVALTEPDFMDRDGLNYEEMTKKFIDRYKTKPSTNHYRGYETIYFLGKMLHAYGKYFQEGLRPGNFNSAKVFEGFKYGTSNDNQVVPIVRFNDAKLEVVNRDLYEDREE